MLWRFSTPRYTFQIEERWNCCHRLIHYMHRNLWFDKNSATKNEINCIQSILIFICVQLPGTWSKTHHSPCKYILLLHLKVTKIISKIYWFAIHLVFFSYKNCFPPGADNQNFKHLKTSASFFLACFSAAVPDYLWISLLPKCKLLNEWLLCQIATLGTFIYLIYTFLFTVL